MRIALFLPALGLLAACSAPDAPQSADPAAAPAAAAARPEPLDTARASLADPLADTLKTVRRRHVFSAPASPDEFELTLRGRDVLTGQLTFTITDASGQVIFREMLTPADLEASLAYEMQTPTVTPAEREAYIRRRMDEFFADKNFRQPALTPKDAYQEGGADRPTWTELQQRPDAVGFVYLVGKEDRRRIAYAPGTRQVVQLPGLGS
ncbi:hypothetical protein KLP40_01010 [Hymenobacter sp. NST-14]|uniref:hypothetical protein n=1 Tax=Hymenobacter piscis TaxID=2839984 RepID=UPI001C01D9B6|nr:hypothetical protein [Hymenobacter piscis]MBT9391726.1 hypothetical protein [Hymenobacter piscis]